jgi:hypothetical protein
MQAKRKSFTEPEVQQAVVAAELVAATVVELVGAESTAVVVDLEAIALAGVMVVATAAAAGVRLELVGRHNHIVVAGPVVAADKLGLAVLELVAATVVVQVLLAELVAERTAVAEVLVQERIGLGLETLAVAVDTQLGQL